MAKITIVYDDKTNKLLPFVVVPPFGEIVITSSGMLQGTARVAVVDPLDIDFLNMTITERNNGEEEN